MKIRIIISFVLVLVLAGQLFAGDAQVSGMQIMQRSFDRDVGEDSFFAIDMVLIDKNQGERTRKLNIYTKDYGARVKSLIRFTGPADIEYTAFLSWEQENKDDTQYLYLPALKRARRIVSNQKSLRFVNTDYSYEDMQRRDPGKDIHTFLGRAKYNSFFCYVVESVPVDTDNSQYCKRVNWVDADSFVVVRTDFIDKKNKMRKQFSVEELKQIDGIWTVMRTHMQDFKDEHTTSMNVIEAKYNQGLEDSLFSLRALEEGRL